MYSSVDRLPPPQTSLQSELDFRRRLRGCHNHIQSSEESSASLCSDPAFHELVVALQDALSDLETASGRRISGDLLAQYRRCVDDISRQLLPVATPLIAKALAARPKEPLSNGVDSTSAPCQTRHESTSQSSGPQLRQRQAANFAAMGFSDHMRRNDDMQEMLTDELVLLAAGLKRNTQAMQTAVEQRGDLLDKTDQELERNVGNAKRSAKEAGVAGRKGRRSFWFTVLVLFSMGMAFTGMYVFIRATSFAGYRRIVVQR